MREVFIREREPEDLVRVLMNYDRVKQVKLLDLDGTLHKGLYERRLRGFTSADIALDLMPVMWSSPRYIRNNLEIFLKERETLYMNVKGEKREEVTRDLVHMFSEALERVDFEELYNVVKRLPERAYPKAKEVLSMVQGDPVIISCALQQVVNSYCVFLNARGVGNPLRQKSEGVSNEGRGVYGAEDKEFVADFVCQEYERAVVFGDEYEDVGMAKVAKEINPESVVVAMHGRSEELEDVADIVANSWEDVGEFVYSNWNKACMSKSEREVA